MTGTTISSKLLPFEAVLDHIRRAPTSSCPTRTVSPPS